MGDNNLQLNQMIGKSAGTALAAAGKSFPQSIAKAVSEIGNMVKRADSDEYYRQRLLAYFDSDDYVVLRCSLIATAGFLLAYSE